MKKKDFTRLDDGFCVFCNGELKLIAKYGDGWEEPKKDFYACRECGCQYTLTQGVGWEYDIDQEREEKMDLDKLELEKIYNQGYGFYWKGKGQAVKEVENNETEYIPYYEGNLYIEGDNLTALKRLQKDYQGKIKCIYMDPPYNTNRKFIMVQLPENCEEKSEAYKAGYKNICEIGKERIRRAGAKIKSDEKLSLENREKLDIGFKVVKL